MIEEYRRNLSIIIPHYNTPDLLEKLINSIPHIKDIQILVIDDNSNVQLNKLHALQIQYGSCVEFYKNDTPVKGAGTCRNIGLQHADGKWILFADADDFFLEGMYETVRSFFKSDYDQVFFTPTSIYLDTGALANRHLIFEKRINDYANNPTRENLLNLKIATTSPWSCLIKHDLLREHDIWFDEVLYSNDIMFMAKVGHYGKYVAVSKSIIYCITRNKGSLTTYIDWDAFQIRMFEYIRVCQFIKEHYSKKDMKTMRYTCLGMLYKAMREHHGISKYIYIIRIFHKSGIPMFSWNQLGLERMKQLIREIRTKRLDAKYYMLKNNSDK